METPLDDTRYQGDIELRHLSFRYADATDDVLTDLSLTIRENRTTAFVGSSGAGKSTLLDLVLALQDPTSGTIECGGRSIFAMSTVSLPRVCADVTTRRGAPQARSRGIAKAAIPASIRANEPREER